jgi:hypothetical protein
MENTVFERLSRSKFRSSFRLKGRELEYLKNKGIETILSHGKDFINERLKHSEIKNDGKQTPMRNHPFFIAQHATGMCCRKCLEKWHGIKKGKELTDEEINYLLKITEIWLKKFI